MACVSTVSVTCSDAENEESVHTDKTAPSDKKAESNCEHAPKDQGGEKKQERDNDGDNLSPESGTSKTNELESTLDGAIAETDSPMVFDESGSGETVRAATRPSDAPDLARGELVCVGDSIRIGQGFMYNWPALIYC